MTETSTITSETSTQFLENTTTSIESLSASTNLTLSSIVQPLCGEISGIIKEIKPKVNIQKCKECNKEGWVKSLDFIDGNDSKDRLVSTRFGFVHLDCLPPVNKE